MKREFRDGFACWEFKGYGTELKYQEFLKLSSEEIQELYNDRLRNLIIVIDEFKFENLFIPKKINFNHCQKEIKTTCTSKEVVNEIKSIIEESEAKELIAFWIDGDSYIYDENETKHENVISILYEVCFDLISITTNDDLWMPVGIYSDFWSSFTPDRESLINLDRAKVNSKRLEGCLLRVKEKGDFKLIYPDINEAMKDYLTIQKGFRMYYGENVFKGLNINSETFDQLREFLIK